VFRVIIITRMNPSNGTRAGGEPRMRLARPGRVSDAFVIIAFPLGMGGKKRQLYGLQLTGFQRAG
jgi:hypothetical protein